MWGRDYIIFFLREFSIDFSQTWYEYEGTWGECFGIFSDFSDPKYGFEIDFENWGRAFRTHSPSSLLHEIKSLLVFFREGCAIKKFSLLENEQIIQITIKLSKRFNLCPPP